MLKQYIYYKGIFKNGTIKLNELIEFMEAEEKEKFKSITNEVLNRNVIYINAEFSVFQNEKEQKKYQGLSMSYS